MTDAEREYQREYGRRRRQDPAYREYMKRYRSGPAWREQRKKYDAKRKEEPCGSK